jgi:hypothetical protein
MNYISLTQTGGTGIINNIHDSTGPGGVNIQDSSNNILTISNAGDISCNSLHTTNLYIGGNSTIFRFVPWTVYKNPVNNFTDVVNTALTNGNLDSTSPAPATGSNWSYSYSIIGNTMYVNFQYTVNDNTSGITAGGIYLYKIPPTYTINTDIFHANNYYGQPNTDFGSQVGTCSLTEYNNRYTTGPVRITTLAYNGLTYLYLLDYNGRDTPQGSGWFSYANTYNNITFVASFPIN